MKRKLRRARMAWLLVSCCGVLATPLRAQRHSTNESIASSEMHVRLYPQDYAGYDGLGAAYLQKGRETGDADYYERAKNALTKSLDLLSEDPAAAPAMTHMAVVCMSEHRFTDALAWAQKALALGSGDLSPWAVVGDALADMGDYAEAVEAYAKLQSPYGSQDERLALSYERDARMSSLRLVKGDAHAAIELMQDAIRAAAETRVPAENIAWSYYQLGEEFFQTGNYTAADRAYTASLDEYPSYYRALGGLAKVRSAEGKLNEAVEFYKKALAVVPFPEYAAALGDVYWKLGKPDEAQKEYDLVEFIGRLSELNREIHNRDLALFYADHDSKLAESLALARKELDVRRDVYTWDVLAWSLFKNGKNNEAADAISQALQQGTEDALIDFHAGMIYERLGDLEAAKRFLHRTLNVSPGFHVLHAETAKNALARLEAQSSAAQNHVAASGDAE